MTAKLTESQKQLLTTLWDVNHDSLCTWTQNSWKRKISHPRAVPAAVLRLALPGYRGNLPGDLAALESSKLIDNAPHASDCIGDWDFHGTYLRVTAGDIPAGDIGYHVTEAGGRVVEAIRDEPPDLWFPAKHYEQYGISSASLRRAIGKGTPKVRARKVDGRNEYRDVDVRARWPEKFQ